MADNTEGGPRHTPAHDTETRFVAALMQGDALDGPPASYQMIMGMALAIYLSDRKLQRPLDRFAKYLTAYAEGQQQELLHLRQGTEV